MYFSVYRVAVVTFGFSVYRVAVVARVPWSFGWCCFPPNAWFLFRAQLTPMGDYWERNTKNPKDQNKRETADAGKKLGAAAVLSWNPTAEAGKKLGATWALSWNSTPSMGHSLPRLGRPRLKEKPIDYRVNDILPESRSGVATTH